MQNQLCGEYTKYNSGRQLVLPLNTEILIPNDESVRLLDQVLEELDYTKLYLTYSDKGRNPSADPQALFKVIVYAYSQNIFSSRKIEEACTYDIRYHYLLQSSRAPDHNTINRFRKHHLKGAVLEELFSQFTEKLMEAGALSLSEVFIDGTKIEANANKYTFVWKGSVEKNYEKLRENASEYLHEELGIDLPAEGVTSKTLKKAFQQVRIEVKRKKIEFVHGTGKRKHVLQRRYETVEDLYERAYRYEEGLCISRPD